MESMDINGNGHKLKTFVDEKLRYYDGRFTTLETSIDRLVQSIDRLTNSVEEFKGYWGKAIPIKLVFYILALVIGGQTVVGVMKYLVP